MKYDCTGVACCLAIDYLPGVRNTEIRLEIDTCGVNDTVEMTWTVERKTGTETFNGLSIGTFRLNLFMRVISPPHTHQYIADILFLTCLSNFSVRLLQNVKFPSINLRIKRM